MLGMACVFAGCGCTAGIIIERGNRHMLCVQRTFACPCVAGGCSCTRNPSGGDGEGLSPNTSRDFILAHFFPLFSNTEQKELNRSFSEEKQAG